jgi:NADH:ubiquinone oxidoreductase subunit 2 (subunit N)
MKEKHEIYAIGITAIITGLISIVLAQNAIFSPSRTLQTAMLLKVMFTSINIVLLLGLTANYLKIYRDMKTPISRSLAMFSSALMLYAVSSNPLIHVLMGFDIISVGLFTFLPDIFVTLAASIILRESYR